MKCGFTCMKKLNCVKAATHAAGKTSDAFLCSLKDNGHEMVF